MLVDEVAGRVLLVGLVCGHPQVPRGEGGAPVDVRLGVGEQRRLAFGVERVADRAAQAVFHARVGDEPDPTLGVVG